MFFFIHPLCSLVFINNILKSENRFEGMFPYPFKYLANRLSFHTIYRTWLVGLLEVFVCLTFTAFATHQHNTGHKAKRKHLTMIDDLKVFTILNVADAATCRFTDRQMDWWMDRQTGNFEIPMLTVIWHLGNKLMSYSVNCDPPF